MKYIYHYSVSTQEIVGTLTRADGLAIRSSPVLGVDDYMDLKKAIAETHDFSVPQMTVHSLSLVSAQRPTPAEGK